MTDFAEFERIQNKYRLELEKAVAHNKALIFDALEAAKITSVTVGFDGEGDSGQIHDVAAFSGNDAATLPHKTLHITELTWGSRVWRSSGDVSFADALDRVCYDLLEQEHGGWENNDGAFGEFTFDVEKRTIRLEFNARFTDHETTEHEF